MNDLTRLSKPVAPQFVKQPAPGKYGTYVDHEIINQILLLTVGPFSFEIQQVFYNPEGLLDGCTASLTATVDGKEVTITEAGDCEHAANKKTQGERLKNAASDALKRCSMRLGLGLHLWAGEQDYFLYTTLSSRGDTAQPRESGDVHTAERRPISPPSDVAEAPNNGSASASPDISSPVSGESVGATAGSGSLLPPEPEPAVISQRASR